MLMFFIVHTLGALWFVILLLVLFHLRRIERVIQEKEWFTPEDQKRGGK